MAFKHCSVALIIVVLTGCSRVSFQQKHMYEQGYRAGVNEQVRAIAGEFQGGNFPYYHWASPIVQEVNIPGHIQNGVFIPAHKELVIIKPGEWAQNAAYPIQSKEENYGNTTHMVMDSADITHLPNGNGTERIDEPTGKNAHRAEGMARNQ